MKNYLKKYHRTLGIVGAVAAATIAAIYLLVTPEEIANTGLFQNIVLAYGHSLCWLLLCAASIVWAVKRENGWSVPLVYSALVVYVIFVSVLLLYKFM